MIYCYGLRVKYDAKLESGKPFYKIGRGFHDFSFHHGGAVWKTPAEVRDHLLKNGIEGRGIYDVLADWETDTVQIDDEPYRRLLKSAQVVRLPSDAEEEV